MSKGRSKPDSAQLSFLENYGKTAPAVPAIRAAVRQWSADGYPGATATTKRLLNYWFYTDHKLPNGQQFSYYEAQKEAIESMVYVFEIAKTRNLTSLYSQFIPAELAGKFALPQYDDFARYCTKMATGSGKTKVMSLAIAWQFFNALNEADDAYARTFLIIAPNVIVFERLRTDFASGRAFKEDPIIPKDLRLFWDMQFYVRGEAERASSMGAVYLTNIQQLYDGHTLADDEPPIMTAVLGAKPPATLNGSDNFRERILKRTGGPIMVLNDEAHHTHDPESVWNETIRSLHDAHPHGVAVQLDVSATPRYESGALFAWTISDYTLKQAIIHRIVKRPIKGVTDIGEVASSVPSVKYEPFITCGVERWREYREQLSPMGKKPLLFIMLNNTDEADSIGDYLRHKYRDEFGGDKTLIIHTDKQGEVSKKDLDAARKAAREVDEDASPINAIVSVLMLREGWDVKNVTVIVGLRPYTSKANILPEQTIGRGLRLMFRNTNSSYIERVDIIGNRGFINFVEQLEQDEEFQFDTWQVGKEKLVITLIEPDPSKAEYDIALPILSPILTRQTALQQEIDAIDINSIRCNPLPIKADNHVEKTFTYEGRDILTMEKLFERQYRVPSPQTSQEIVSYYAQAIAQELKLPSQFAILAPKVRDFLKYRAFGKEVDLDNTDILQAISRRLAMVVTMTVFLELLRDKLIQPQQPVLESPGKMLSGMSPFPWSQLAPVCQKSIFNKVPCDNQFEEDFARFLDQATDVARFSKLPMNFGFSIPYTDVAGNLRQYYPDFVVVDRSGVHYLVETKGREDTDVANKDRSAVMWAERATELTGQQWGYVKVMQKTFKDLQPAIFADCVYIGSVQVSMFEDNEVS
jgi:type III restriction enzyme